MLKGETQSSAIMEIIYFLSKTILISVCFEETLYLKSFKTMFEVLNNVNLIAIF